MTAHLKALVVVLPLMLAALALFKSPVCTLAMSAQAYGRRSFLWVALTLVLFLAHNFWIYIGVSGILLFFFGRSETSRFAMFVFLLFALPPIEADIRGVGPIRTLFAIEGYRLLSLAVLLPAFLALRKSPASEPFGRSLADKLVLVHIILFYFLKAGGEGVSATDALRQAVFYPFIEIFLPYYVASRSLQTLQDFREVLAAFIVGALVVGVIGAFETTKGWLLYGNVDEALGAKEANIYAAREGTMRAVATFGIAIPFGYVMAVATGIYLYVGKSLFNPTAAMIGWLVLLGGLLASLSRGPWVGAAMMVMVFVLTGATAFSSTLKLSTLGLFCLPLLLLPMKEKQLYDYLPFIGTVQSENVTYRFRLLDAGLAVIMRYPWFGTLDALTEPEMKAMKQGQGIIDVVNSYLLIGLERGIIGLAIFVAFFAVVLFGIFKRMRTFKDKRDERHVIGQALLATLLGILGIIVTVSSISIIPWVYWTLGGIGVAYARSVALAKGDAKSPAGPPAASELR